MNEDLQKYLDEDMLIQLQKKERRNLLSDEVCSFMFISVVMELHNF